MRSSSTTYPWPYAVAGGAKVNPKKPLSVQAKQMLAYLRQLRRAYPQIYDLVASMKHPQPERRPSIAEALAWLDQRGLEISKPEQIQEMRALLKDLKRPCAIMPIGKRGCWRRSRATMRRAACNGARACRIWSSSRCSPHWHSLLRRQGAPCLYQAGGGRTGPTKNTLSEGNLPGNWRHTVVPEPVQEAQGTERVEPCMQKTLPSLGRGGLPMGLVESLEGCKLAQCSGGNNAGSGTAAAAHKACKALSVRGAAAKTASQARRYPKVVGWYSSSTSASGDVLLYSPLGRIGTGVEYDDGQGGARTA